LQQLQMESCLTIRRLKDKKMGPPCPWVSVSDVSKEICASIFKANTQPRGVTSQKTWILSSTAVRTTNLPRAVNCRVKRVVCAVCAFSAKCSQHGVLDRLRVEYNIRVFNISKGTFDAHCRVFYAVRWVKVRILMTLQVPTWSEQPASITQRYI
jgi:hypothetical protein